MNTKTIITILLIALIAFTGGYFYFTYKKTGALPTFQFRTFPPSGELQPPPQEITKPTEEKRGVLTTLVAEPVIGATLSREKNSVFYVARENGNVYRLNFDGQGKSRISNITIVGIYHAQWSPDKSKIFLAYERDDSIKKLILDLSTTPPTSSIVPNTTRSVAWSQDGKTLYMLEEFSSGVRLIAADALGKKGKELLRIPLGDLNILPYGGSSLYFMQPPSAFAVGPLFEWNQKTGSFRELLSGKGFTALISPRGEKFLLSFLNHTDNFSALQMLALKNFPQTTLLRDLVTLPEKCVWHNEDVVFCGVPKNSFAGKAMPDEYYKGTLSLEDDLIKTTISTQNAVVYNEVSGFDMQDLFTDEKGENVFFRDAKTDFLYRFSLPE